MKRLIDWHLMRWKNSKTRKSLLLRGARQVGKTYAIRKLGKSFENCIEVNFEITKELKAVFHKNLDPKRIVKALSVAVNEPIIPGKTLLFFDEVQECPEVITALRYFYEMMPDLHVIAAGSLLDFAIEKVGMPVGRVSSLQVFPLSFVEFLLAKKESMLVHALLDHKTAEPFFEVLHNKLLDLIGEYFAIGGMPEAIIKWLDFNDPKECFQVHFDIANSYRQDFEKYAKRHEIKYMEELFRQIPHFVGQQFQYKNLPGDMRKRDLAPCMDLLEKAGVIRRIYHTSAQGLPIGSGMNLNWFKAMYLDIALCQTQLGLDLRTWFLDPGREFVNRGMIAEAFVGMEMLAYTSPIKTPQLYYWRRAERSSSSEIDYVIEHERMIIPVEVKSGTKGTLKSMNLFLEKHSHSPFGVQFSQNNFSEMGKIRNYPLYSMLLFADEDQLEAIMASLS